MSSMDEQMMATVFGLVSKSAVDRSGNYGSAELSMVLLAPPGALASVSEGFCPNCRVPLAGDLMRNWCRSCKVTWHIRRGTTESAS